MPVNFVDPKNVVTFIKDKLDKRKAANELKKLKKNADDRETWTGKFDFFLSTLGYAGSYSNYTLNSDICALSTSYFNQYSKCSQYSIGLGAVWRFPYLCYRNGGGVFLIPYFIFLILVGIPLVFLELVVGQFTSTGPLTSWTMVPFFKGIGLATNIANTYLNIYYNMIIAYSLYFLVLSFTSKLPWENCNPAWSSTNCVDDYTPGKFNYTSCTDNSTLLRCDDSFNFGRCFNLTTLNGTLATCSTNRTLLQQVGWWKTNFPSQDYWTNVILRKSDSIDNSGALVWQLVLALFVAWLIVYLMVVNGINVSGKLVYFTSLFPYVVLLILGIRGWILPGAEIGIKFYISPDFSRLSDIRVWMDAAAQIFFTLSTSYGGLVALSSYNKFSTNIYRDAIIVSLSNCLTSIFAGFVVFAYIGYLAKNTGQEISEIIQAGQGLAYVVYPYAVTTIAGAPFWAILFFFMMIILGLDTMMTGVETTITSFLDFFPKIKKKKIYKVLTITILCIAHFLIGLLFCLQSGTYWVEFFNNYAGDWATLLVGAIECITVAWFYGAKKNFRKDIRVMIGAKYTDNFTYYIWCACWWVISPLLLIVLVILALKDLKKLEITDYVFPDWSHILGEFLTVSTLFGIIFYNVYAIVDVLFLNKRPFLTIFKPDFANYKPAKLENQRLVMIERGQIEVTKAHDLDHEFIDGETRF